MDLLLSSRKEGGVNVVYMVSEAAFPNTSVKEQIFKYL